MIESLCQQYLLLLDALTKCKDNTSRLACSKQIIEILLQLGRTQRLADLHLHCVFCNKEILELLRDFDETDAAYVVAQRAAALHRISISYTKMAEQSGITAEQTVMFRLESCIHAIAASEASLYDVRFNRNKKYTIGRFNESIKKHKLISPELLEKCETIIDYILIFDSAQAAILSHHISGAYYRLLEKLAPSAPNFFIFLNKSYHYIKQACEIDPENSFYRKSLTYLLQNLEKPLRSFIGSNKDEKNIILKIEANELLIKILQDSNQSNAKISDVYHNLSSICIAAKSDSPVNSPLRFDYIDKAMHYADLAYQLNRNQLLNYANAIESFATFHKDTKPEVSAAHYLECISLITKQQDANVNSTEKNRLLYFCYRGLHYLYSYYSDQINASKKKPLSQDELTQLTSEYQEKLTSYKKLQQSQNRNCSWTTPNPEQPSPVINSKEEKEEAHVTKKSRN